MTNRIPDSRAAFPTAEIRTFVEEPIALWGKSFLRKEWDRKRIGGLGDLSPLSHPPMSRVLASFEPCWLGGATGRGAGPST